MSYADFFPRPRLTAMVAVLLLAIGSPLRAGEGVYLGETLQDPGVKWLTTDYLPVRLKPGHGYDWRQADTLVRRAQAHGLRILARPYFMSGAPLTTGDYCAALVAAATRYNFDGQDDMPGLKYAVTEWIVDGALHPEAAHPDDPASLADFAFAAYSSLRLVDTRARVIIAAGACGPLGGSRPVANAGYQEQLFGRLGQDFAGAPPLALVIAFDLAAEAGDFARLGPLSEFWRDELKIRRLEGAECWLLSATLSEAKPAEVASELVKLHLCGAAAGIQKIFYFTPVPAGALDGDPTASLAEAQRVQGREASELFFRLAVARVEGADWPRTRLESSDQHWVLTFVVKGNTVMAVWNERAGAGGENKVQMNREQGLVWVERMTPEARIENSTLEIVDSRVTLPDSNYPAFIRMDGTTDDCHCHDQEKK
jgi:hypothetical protein